MWKWALIFTFYDQNVTCQRSRESEAHIVVQKRPKKRKSMSVSQSRIAQPKVSPLWSECQVPGVKRIRDPTESPIQLWSTNFSFVKSLNIHFCSIDQEKEKGVLNIANRSFQSLLFFHDIKYLWTDQSYLPRKPSSTPPSTHRAPSRVLHVQLVLLVLLLHHVLPPDDGGASCRPVAEAPNGPESSESYTMRQQWAELQNVTDRADISV